MTKRDELGSKLICSQCVSESYLSAKIEGEGEEGACSYCNDWAACIKVEDLASRVDDAFDQHFSRTSDQPDDFQSALLRDRELDYEWWRSGSEVVDAIAEAAGLREEAALDVQEILEEKYFDFEAGTMGIETEFAGDSHYEWKTASDDELQLAWNAFERSLKNEARFFSKSAAALLKSVFSGLPSMQSKDGRPLVRTIGPGADVQALFRARVFQSLEPLIEAVCKPDVLLGSHASKYAAAGRMNAHGISVFYGASSAEVAIAEVRPPVGSHVGVAQFFITRPMRVLDLAALGRAGATGSIFDPDFVQTRARAVFLQSISARITKPVMPDHQAFEYLTTQAIADFLAAGEVEALDGIAYPSVQVAGDAVNIVLFHHASLVESIELPPGAKVSASFSADDDESQPECYVLEKLPEDPSQEGADGGAATDHFFDDVLPFDFDAGVGASSRETRTPSLRIDLDSVCVHEVRRVQFETLTIRVHRSRHKASKSVEF